MTSHNIFLYLTNEISLVTSLFFAGYECGVRLNLIWLPLKQWTKNDVWMMSLWNHFLKICSIQQRNPISSEGLRWNFKHPDLGPASGMAPELDRFDAQFFAVHSRLGYYMDPMSRKLLEQAYQAIYDAGKSLYPKTTYGDQTRINRPWQIVSYL